MSEIALGGFSVVMVALLALGAAAAMGVRLVAAGSLALCGVGAVLAVAVLADGAAPAVLALPLGPPGASMTLAIDGLSGFFLLLLFLSGGAACTAALDDDGAGATLPLLLAAMVFLLTAADGFALVLGIGLSAVATSRLELGRAVLAAVCVVVALGLLGDGAWGFAALRGHAVDGWRGAVVLVLVLIGVGAAVPRVQTTPVPAVATGVVVYLAIRVLVDLCGPGQPLWWALFPFLLGAGAAVWGALRANMAGDLRSIFYYASVANTGLIAVGLGVALAARAADLVPLVALALGAVFLLALAHALFISVLLLGAGAIETGAGSRQLDRLGGQIHAMPVTTACMLAGAAALAGLPPTVGFAGQWALFQALFAAPRAGGLGLQMLIAGVVAVLALAVALNASAMVRLVGVALLGRPRSPRAAVATEVGAGARLAMAGLAFLSVVVGLFPGAVLALAGPALRLLADASMARRSGALGIAAQADAPGYAALAIALLLGLAGAAAVALLRGAAGGKQGVPAWECGAEPPPPWLPFGDPLTEYGGASVAQPLRRVLGGGVFSVSAPVGRRVVDRAARLAMPTVRQVLAVIAAAVVLALLLMALAGQL